MDKYLLFSQTNTTDCLYFNDEYFTFRRGFMNTTFSSDYDDVIFRYCCTVGPFGNRYQWPVIFMNRCINGEIDVIEISDEVKDKIISIWDQSEHISNFLACFCSEARYKIFKTTNGRKINYIINSIDTIEHMKMFNIENYDIIKIEDSFIKDNGITVIYDEYIDNGLRLIYDHHEIIS